MWSCECQCCNFSLKELLLHEGEKEIDFTAMGSPLHLPLLWPVYTGSHWGAEVIINFPFFITTLLKLYQ